MVNSIFEEKQLLRKQHKDIRRALSFQNKNISDINIAEKALELPCYKKCDTVLVYVSTDSEVGTKLIIEDAIKDGKTVAVPKCIINTKHIDFYSIKSYDDLILGSFGILEPDIEKCTKITDLCKSICFVPGLAFDTDGYRLGYGGGYYDRFLQSFCGISVGLCYNINLTVSLPKDEYDQKVNYIVTEDNIITLSGG